MKNNQKKFTNIGNTFFYILPIITFTTTTVFATYIVFALFQNLIFQSNIPIPFLFSGLGKEIVNVFQQSNIKIPITLIKSLIGIIRFSLFGCLLLVFIECFPKHYPIRESFIEQFFLLTLFINMLLLLNLFFRFFLY